MVRCLGFEDEGKDGGIGIKREGKKVGNKWEVSEKMEHLDR